MHLSGQSRIISHFSKITKSIAYDFEVIIFKIDAEKFFDVVEEEAIKNKRKLGCFDNPPITYIKTVILLRLGYCCREASVVLSEGLFVSPGAENWLMAIIDYL